jgi:hypothetical protein
MELLAYLHDDPATTVTACSLSRLPTPASSSPRHEGQRRLSRPSAGALAARRGAMSHMAALATDNAFRDASLRQVGVIPVRTGLQVLDAVRALSSHLPPAGGGLRW